MIVRDNNLSRVFRAVRRQTVSFRHHKLSTSPNSIAPCRIRVTLRLKLQVNRVWNETQTGFGIHETGYVNEMKFMNLKNYSYELPFNRRACLDKFANPRPTTDRHDTTARPSFQSCRRKRLNRQCRSLPDTPYLKTNIAILAQQRDTSLFDNWQQMLLQTRRCQGFVW